MHAQRAYKKSGKISPHWKSNKETKAPVTVERHQKWLHNSYRAGGPGAQHGEVIQIGPNLGNMATLTLPSRVSHCIA